MTAHFLNRVVLTLIGALVASSCLSAWAFQSVDVRDPQAHLVKISKLELSRIAVEGGKIRKLDYLDGELEVKKDDETGSYLVMPLVPKPINIFVTTSSGQTHALILQPTDIPLESIVLREAPAKTDDPKRTRANIERAGSLELAVKRLTEAMARNETPSEFDVTPFNQEVALWNESRFVLVERYIGRSIIGEHFRLTNISKSVMRLAEQELFKKGVVSVSIERQVLNPGETTDVFITKVANDG